MFLGGISMNNLDGLVDDGAVLLGVLLLVDHRLVLGLVVGRRRQGRRVLVNWMNGTIREREDSGWVLVRFSWPLNHYLNCTHPWNNALTFTWPH